MNIAFMIRNVNPTAGGTERVTFSITNNLKNYGYDSFYIFSGKDYDEIPTTHKLNIRLKNKKLIYHLLCSFLRRNNIKILVVVNQVYQNSLFQKVFVCIKNTMDIKIVGCLHASPDNWVNKDKFGLVMFKVYLKDLIKELCYSFYNPYKIRAIGMFNLSDKYLLLSENYKSTFEKVMGINDRTGKLVAIPNPFPFGNVRYDASSKRENIVLIVARMDENQKRIGVALKMWRDIEPIYQDWRLVIVGEGKDLTGYKHIVKKLHLKNVIFKGHSNNVQEFYKKSKIFWMTSIWEGLPMTLIEAQHYGCICIAFDSFKAVRDVIDNGKNGFYVNCNDCKAFVNVTKQLMQNQSVIYKMQENIINNISPKFDIKNIIPMWLSLFEELKEN